jgi:WD40 repeat protein
MPDGIIGFDWHPTNPNEMVIAFSGRLELWNPQTSQQQAVLTTFSSDIPPSYSPQTGQLAFQNGTFDVEVWDTQSQQLVCVVNGPSEILYWGWVGNDLLTTELDGTQRRWNLQTGESNLIPTDIGFRSWKPDGTAYLLFASGRLVLTDTGTGNVQAQLVLSADWQVSSFTANRLTIPLSQVYHQCDGSDRLEQVNPENLVLVPYTNPNSWQRCF